MLAQSWRAVFPFERPAGCTIGWANNLHKRASRQVARKGRLNIRAGCRTRQTSGLHIKTCWQTGNRGVPVALQQGGLACTVQSKGGIHVLQLKTSPPATDPPFSVRQWLQVHLWIFTFETLFIRHL